MAILFQTKGYHDHAKPESKNPSELKRVGAIAKRGRQALDGGRQGQKLIGIGKESRKRMNVNRFQTKFEMGSHDLDNDIYYMNRSNEMQHNLPHQLCQCKTFYTNTQPVTQCFILQCVDLYQLIVSAPLPALII